MAVRSGRIAPAMAAGGMIRLSTHPGSTDGLADGVDREIGCRHRDKPVLTKAESVAQAAVIISQVCPAGLSGPVGRGQDGRASPSLLHLGVERPGVGQAPVELG